MKRKSRKGGGDISSPAAVNLTDLAFDIEPNIPKFDARLDPPPSAEQCAQFVYGEGWDESHTYIEADAIRAYHEGATPHLDFVNLQPSIRAISPERSCEGEKEALEFLADWGPLRRKDYVPTKQIVDEQSHMRYLLEPLCFRTPLNEFWQEQKRFRDLVALWDELSSGSKDQEKSEELAAGLNPALRQMYPNLEGTYGPPIASFWGQHDLLASLCYCLWSDIAQKRQVRRCKDQFCQKFFRPSRESQLYHTETCKRRQLQREYAREKREAAKRNTRKIRRTRP